MTMHATTLHVYPSYRNCLVKNNFATFSKKYVYWSIRNIVCNPFCCICTVKYNWSMYILLNAYSACTIIELNVQQIILTLHRFYLN
jgi:hypothetical protein